MMLSQRVWYEAEVLINGTWWTASESDLGVCRTQFDTPEQARSYMSRRYGDRRGFRVIMVILTREALT